MKFSAREKRWKGIRRKVQEDSFAPTNWQGFFCLSESKKGLFRFLSREVLFLGEFAETFLAAFDDTFMATNAGISLAGVNLCNHEEADTRVLLHVTDMVKQGHRKVSILQWTKML